MELQLNQTKTLQQRIRSIDIVRGFVMIVMALDHTRDLFHTTALTQNPLDLNTTTPGLFFTRWITHFCAPMFVFLSGASAYLSYKLRSSVRDSRMDLLKRGIWLIILELTLVNFALWFDVQFRIFLLQVIAAIGFGFIVLALIIKVNPVKTTVAALLIIFLHNLLPAERPANQTLNFLYNLTFQPGLRTFSSGTMLFIAYPIIPWIGIMMLGFSLGRIFQQEWTKQKKALVSLGVLFIAVFIAIRAFNVYGDPAPWSSRDNFLYTVMSFINVTKYPPSLLFTLLFLGIMFLLLRFSNNLNEGAKNFLSVYGKVPLFYYLLHLYFIRIGVFIAIFAQGYSYKDLLFGPFQFGRPADWGFRLLIVYGIWIVIVLALYPLCKWWGKVKERNRGKWWLKYL